MKYNAKILLFGEHTVVKGSQALAMPLKKYFGTWQFVTNTAEKQIKQQQLPQFLHYLNEQNFNTVLDLPIFLKDLNKGIYFHSSIPTGYGMGSSGALCAGIFSRYKRQDVVDLSLLKSLLGKMESFFHGSSSGMDPLVCYLNYPILFSSVEQLEQVALPTTAPFGESTLFLINTHIKRSTAPYVNGFLERCQVPAYNDHCAAVLVPAVNKSITAYLEGNWAELYKQWTLISTYQYTHFDFMIPDSFKTIWKKGLDSDAYKLKICGAGGGGFLLGISKDLKKTEKKLEKFNLINFLKTA